MLDQKNAYPLNRCIPLTRYIVLLHTHIIKASPRRSGAISSLKEKSFFMIHKELPHTMKGKGAAMYFPERRALLPYGFPAIIMSLCRYDISHVYCGWWLSIPPQKYNTLPESGQSFVAILFKEGSFLGRWFVRFKRFSKAKSKRSYNNLSCFIFNGYRTHCFQGFTISLRVPRTDVIMVWRDEKQMKEMGLLHIGTPSDSWHSL